MAEFLPSIPDWEVLSDRVETPRFAPESVTIAQMEAQVHQQITGFLSHYSCYVDSFPWIWLMSAKTKYYAAQMSLKNPKLEVA